MSDGRVAIPPLFDRHPGVRNLMRWLTPNTRLPREQFVIAERLHTTARYMLQRVPDSPELTEGLRKLLEAKDCFVRASLPDDED